MKQQSAFWFSFLLLCAASGAAAERLSPFAAFLPNEELARSLRPVIERLEAESFAEREAASRELTTLAALPPFLREMARTETRPETGQRLRALADAFPLTEENKRLNQVLGEITAPAVKGELPALFRIMERELWEPDEAVLLAAARATVRPEDLPLIAEKAKSQALVCRRLAAAALAGLDPESSTSMLMELSADPDAHTALLAAEALAAGKNAASLAPLTRLLDSPDFSIRHRCHSALQALTGQDFGYDPAAGPEQNADAAAKWREWAASAGAAVSGALPAETAVVLFNGRDLSGWEVRADGVAVGNQQAWRVEQDFIRCVGAGDQGVNPGDLWTTRRFENFVLTLEYRAENPGDDSGVGLLLTEEGEKNAPPGYLEIQTLPGWGGDLYNIGKIDVHSADGVIGFSRRRDADPGDPAGRWHTLRATVRDGAVSVEINGVKVGETTAGPRGPGRVILRNEMAPVAFRRILLYPL